MFCTRDYDRAQNGYVWVCKEAEADRRRTEEAADEERGRGGGVPTHLTLL